MLGRRASLPITRLLCDDRRDAPASLLPSRGLWLFPGGYRHHGRATEDRRSAMADVDVTQRDTTAAPYLGRQPDDMRPDLVVPDIWPADERLWVPLSEGVSSRALHFDVTHGQYTHVMRVTRQGIIAPHRHT